MKLESLVPWFCLLLAQTFITHGQVPSLIHFQGHLTREQQGFNGVGEFKFSLVGGSESRTLWSNDGSGRAGNEPSNAVPVLVLKGLFSVVLGDQTLPNMTPVSPLVFTNSDVRLRVWFRDPRHERRGAFELLTPDQRITSVGYAMFAANVPDGAITAAKLAPDAVGPAVLAPGSVGTRHLVDGSVTTPKLADGAVTREKLSPDAVVPVAIGDGSVLTRHLADNAVTTSKIGDGAVTTSKLVNGAVTTAQLTNGAVTRNKLAAASVGPDQLTNNAVTQEKLALGSVGSDQLAAAAVGSNHLAAGAAVANLMASGQSGIPSSGVILAFEENSSALSSAGYDRSGAFAITPERWEVRTGPASFVYFAQIAVWTSTEVIVGTTTDIRGFQGARYDPRNDLWRPISRIGAPSWRDRPVFLWAGGEMVVWGGYNPSSGTPLQDGVLYNPATDLWRPMTTNGAPVPRFGATVVWTGSEMILWGGLSLSGSFELSSGGRYDPVRNEWLPISTAGCPTARYNHTAVWSGEEMIVWGGQTGDNPRSVFNTGGRYRPDTDRWTNTPTVSAPPGATDHTAIWTGTEMIVWGGGSANLAALRTGARYSPTNNSWQPISLVNAPAGRAAHSSVWTGREMIVWGGLQDIQSNVETGTGGRYNPTTGAWFPLTTDGAPIALRDHEAFWLGDGMLIVGGIPAGNIDSSIMPFWRPAVAAYLYQRR